MKSTRLATATVGAVSLLAILAIALGTLNAQAPTGGPGGSGGRGGGRGRGGFAPALFTALDANKDGSLTRGEMKSTFDAWFTSWDTGRTGSLTQDQLVAGWAAIFPPPPVSIAGAASVTGNSQPLTARQEDIDAMMAALPTTPGVKPLRRRKVLVLAYTGPTGFVHTSIPIAAKTVEALGNRGNLWSTTVTYNPADINAANLKQYDLIFLDNTTGCFLDDANPAVTAARRAAFLDFVRSGKGVAGVHAAADSYRTDCVAASAAAAAAGRGAGGGGRGGTANTLATLILAQADSNNDRKLTRQEFATLADSWYDKLDTDKSGKIVAADFAQRFNAAVMPPVQGPGGGSGRGGAVEAAVLQWPEFNKLIGGYYKGAWSVTQIINVKIDDPKSPLTAMLHGQEFDIYDETYTFPQDAFSRTNVHVLTSIDYDKMSAADKAKERNPRTDGDYAISYIRREGKGRVFYENHGHAEKFYATTPMIEHLRAGIQYALGDLKADDSPSVAAKK